MKTQQQLPHTSSARQNAIDVSLKEPQSSTQSTKKPSETTSVAAVFAAMREIEEEDFDPDILQKLGGPQYGKKRWTFGNSATLVEGAASESPWVSAGWIVVPSGLTMLLLVAMFYA